MKNFVAFQCALNNVRPSPSTFCARSYLQILTFSPCPVRMQPLFLFCGSLTFSFFFWEEFFQETKKNFIFILSHCSISRVEKQKELWASIMSFLCWGVCMRMQTLYLEFEDLPMLSQRKKLTFAVSFSLGFAGLGIFAEGRVKLTTFILVFSTGRRRTRKIDTHCLSLNPYFQLHTIYPPPSHCID